ncbi:MAG: AI-2E family transporter [Patescibacteria group bacterium]
MDKQINVSITPGTVVMTILIGAAAYALWYLRDLVLLVLTAIVIASALEPGIAFFVKYKFPRVIAALTMYLILFGSFFGTIYFFFPPILEDTQAFLLSAPQYLETLNLPQSLTDISVAAEHAAEGESIIDTLFAFRSAFVDTSEGAFRLVSSFFGGVFSLLLVLVLSFYLAIRETGVDDFLRLVTPAKHEDYILDLWRRAHGKIGQWMQGQLLLSLLAGVIIYLGLLILGVPYALLLASFAAVAELIPIFGSYIAAIPALIVAFTYGGFPLAVIVAGLYLIMNLFQANLIYPLVVNKVVGIPPLMVILALLIGGSLAGFLGVLLSVPIAAALQEFIKDFDRAKRKGKTA